MIARGTVWTCPLGWVLKSGQKEISIRTSGLLATPLHFFSCTEKSERIRRSAESISLGPPGTLASPGSSVHGIFLDKNTGVGHHARF